LGGRQLSDTIMLYYGTAFVQQSLMSSLQPPEGIEGILFARAIQSGPTVGADYQAVSQELQYDV
jgi:hypothetical protein